MADPSHTGPSDLEPFQAAPESHPLTDQDMHLTAEALLRERLLQSIGGWRGAVESAVPLLVFALVWSVTMDLKVSLIAAAGALGFLALLCVVQRQPTRFIGYAAIGLAISAIFALRSGKAEAAFLPGMIQNSAMLVGTTLSNLVRWPILGFVVGAADAEQFAEDPVWWRKHPGIVKVAIRLGWVFVAMNTIRLAIMVPLYLAGRTAELALAKAALGWPLYLLALVVMGGILMRGHTPLEEPMPAKRRPLDESSPADA